MQESKDAVAFGGALETLPPKWRNYTVRFVFTWIMIFAFLFLVYLGPLYLVLMVWFDYFLVTTCKNYVVNIKMGQYD